MHTAFIAKSARGGNNSHLPCKAFARLNGGKSAETDGVFDSGCTAPIIIKAVTDNLKMKLSPMKVPLEILQADGTALHIIGSAIIFIEADNLKGRRMIECAVIDRNGSKISNV